MKEKSNEIEDHSDERDETRLDAHDDDPPLRPFKIPGDGFRNDPLYGNADGTYTMNDIFLYVASKGDGYATLSDGDRWVRLSPNGRSEYLCRDSELVKYSDNSFEELWDRLERRYQCLIEWRTTDKTSREVAEASEFSHRQIQNSWYKDAYGLKSVFLDEHPDY